MEKSGRKIEKSENKKEEQRLHWGCYVVEIMSSFGWVNINNNGFLSKTELGRRNELTGALVIP